MHTTMYKYIYPHLLTCECLETQCRSTLRTLLVAARRMMNSLSQVFSVVVKPKQREWSRTSFPQVTLHPTLPHPPLLRLPWELLCPAAAVAMANAEAGDMVVRELSPESTKIPGQWKEISVETSQEENSTWSRVVCVCVSVGPRTSRLPVAEVPRRGRGAAGGDVTRLAGGRWLGNELVQRHRLQHGCKNKHHRWNAWDPSQTRGWHDF